MFEDIKKEISSLKLLITLGTIAVSIYLFQFVLEFLRNFSDVILILVFGWILSFIFEPFVNIFSKKLKVPIVLATAIVFVLTGILITLIFLIFIPDIITQFNALNKILPNVIANMPPQIQSAFDKMLGSFSNIGVYIPSITQFLINLVTVLILSFYLIVDKQNLNRRIFALTPKKFHNHIRFTQKVVNNSFASFVRIQILWGVIGGLITWIVLTIFGIHFAASTSLMAGILTAIPMIGPIIGVIPPLIVVLIENPDQAILIFLIIFLTQQFIYNVLGPKIMGKAFKINPIMVIFSLLIGIKVAGFIGAILAVPVISTISIVGKEFYDYYVKDDEELKLP